MNHEQFEKELRQRESRIAELETQVQTLRSIIVQVMLEKGSPDIMYAPPQQGWPAVSPAAVPVWGPATGTISNTAKQAVGHNAALAKIVGIA
jgi:hypothetical protein